MAKDNEFRDERIKFSSDECPSCGAELEDPEDVEDNDASVSGLKICCSKCGAYNVIVL